MGKYSLLIARDEAGYLAYNSNKVWKVPKGNLLETPWLLPQGYTSALVLWSNLMGHQPLCQLGGVPARPLEGGISL